MVSCLDAKLVRTRPLSVEGPQVVYSTVWVDTKGAVIVSSQYSVCDNPIGAKVFISG